MRQPIRSAAVLFAVQLVATTGRGQTPSPPPGPRDPPAADPLGNPSGATTLGPAAPEGSSFSLYVDQDSVLPWLGPWGGDQNYTMGAGLGLGGSWISRQHLDWPLNGLDSLSGLGKLHARFRNEAGAGNFLESHTLTLAVTAFTPEHLEVTEPVHDDRPYASLLGLTVGHATIDGVKRQVLRTEITLAVLGLHVADSVQTAIHRHRRANNQKKDPAAVTPYDPQGWSHQISDGGEPTAKYTVGYTKVGQETRFHDVGLQGEASLGYYTNVAAGLVLRVGLLRSDLWSLNTNPSPPTTRPPAPWTRPRAVVCPGGTGIPTSSRCMPSVPGASAWSRTTRCSRAPCGRARSPLAPRRSSPS